MIDEYDEFEDDHDAPQVDDRDTDDEGELLACPSCRRLVHEETQQCPYCGDWITPYAADARSRRWLWIAAGVLALGSMIALSVLR